MKEYVEACPYCEAENTGVRDFQKDCFIVKCKECGEEIFLCDECLHSVDNPGRRCDWRPTNVGGQCFRGVTIRRELSCRKGSET